MDLRSSQKEGQYGRSQVGGVTGDDDREGAVGQMLHEPGRWRSRLWWLRIVARGHGGCILKAEPMGFAHILTVKCEKNTSGKSPRTSLGLSPGRMKVPCSCLLRVGRITWLFQPIGNQCRCGTGPLVLTMIATLPSAITIRKLKKKKKVYYFRTWKLHSMLGATE